MKQTILFLLLSSTLIVGCASKKLKPAEDEIDVKANVGLKEIGINDDDEAIIQEVVPVEDELRTLTWENYEIERKLKAEREDLIRCRSEMADPRLSGTKELDPIPELEISEDLSKVQQKVGITKAGRIKVIRKEYLVDRIEKEHRYKDSLESLLKVLGTHRSNCERELGYIRVQHGLPAQRYAALGYYGPEGNFVVTRPAEHNLDEALKIQAEQTRKGKRAQLLDKIEESKLEPVKEANIEEEYIPKQ